MYDSVAGSIYVGLYWRPRCFCCFCCQVTHLSLKTCQPCNLLWPASELRRSQFPGYVETPTAIHDAVFTQIHAPFSLSAPGCTRCTAFCSCPWCFAAAQLLFSGSCCCRQTDRSRLLMPHISSLAYNPVCYTCKQFLKSSLSILVSTYTVSCQSLRGSVQGLPVPQNGARETTLHLRAIPTGAQPNCES